MIAPKDRNEVAGEMEPMLLSATSPRRSSLHDKVLELGVASTRLDGSLPKEGAAALATLVRSMNCYYSNLIEGHDTHPVDIERALLADYSSEPRKRDLQLEACSHIAVQSWIDRGGVNGRAATADGVREIHKQFYEKLPDSFLWSENPESGQKTRVEPGRWREGDVKVGRHIPVSPGAVARFMVRFEEVYAPLGKTESILAAAAAHHRLLCIHPFTDGNGRVARLMSYAMLRDALGTIGIWSISRGLARNEQVYKDHLEYCDRPRRGDLDGRGVLSEAALADFTAFFLDTCLDQVNFMSRLIRPDLLAGRVLNWATNEIRAGRLPSRSEWVLEKLLARGTLERGEVAGLLGVSERTSRRVTAALLDLKVVVSESPRSPLRLGFPATVAHHWLPGLFPEAPSNGD